MKTKTTLLVLWALASAAAAPGCATVSPPKSNILSSQTSCRIAPNHLDPLIVDWQQLDRTALDSQRNEGLIPVAYSGCELVRLPGCHIPSTSYKYISVTRSTKQERIHDQEELEAKLPISAAKVAADLAHDKVLTIDMTIVGQYTASKQFVDPLVDLQGDCERATHFVYAITTGAFRFYGGEDLSASGGVSALGYGVDGKTASSTHELNQNGDPAMCEKPGTDSAPPEGCRASLRLQLQPLGARGGGVGAKAKTRECGGGAHWNGKECEGEGGASTWPWWVAGGAAVVGGAIGGYFLFKKGDPGREPAPAGPLGSGTAGFRF